MYQTKIKSFNKFPHSAGFEPARGDPKRFLVSRLNRSATNASTWYLYDTSGKDAGWRPPPTFIDYETLLLDLDEGFKLLTRRGGGAQQLTGQVSSGVGRPVVVRSENLRLRSRPGPLCVPMHSTALCCGPRAIRSP